MTVKEFRAKTGMDRDKFAEFYGISVDLIKDWEEGRKVPESYMLPAMEQIFYESVASGAFVFKGE